MTDECPTHGTDCPGHPHVEVIRGKAYMSRPGTPLPTGEWLAGGGEPPARSGWEQIGYVSEDAVMYPEDPGTEVRTPTTTRTMPPPWKRPRRDTSIDLDRVRWTARPQMQPLKAWGPFLLSDTEILFLKDLGYRRPW